MYAEYDHEDGYDMMYKLNSNALSKIYLKEDDEERRARLKQEYDDMLLAKNFKIKVKQVLSEYDLMLLGRL